jgi:signal transduction histidine kinase
MPAEIVALQRNWHRWLDAARVLLALAYLAAQLFPVNARSPGFSLLATAFAGYGLLVFVWRREFEKTGAALLCLFVDTLFFLAFTAQRDLPYSWPASAFYSYVLLSAIVLHDSANVFVVAGVCIAFFGVVQSPATVTLRSLVLFTGWMACALAFQKRKLQERLESLTRHEQLAREQTQKACDSVRESIAGDLHDGPLQEVISLQVRLEILKTLLERDRAAGLEELGQLQQLAKVVVHRLRSFLRSMRPLKIDSSDLSASVRHVLEDFQKDTGIAVHYATAEAVVSVPPETCLEVVQILREALHNVQRHAQASRVAISVEKSVKTLEITVEDNGAGFPFSGSFTLEELELLRLGPQSIKRRVRSLGGDLVLESRPGQGASLKIRIPA